MGFVGKTSNFHPTDRSVSLPEGGRDGIYIEPFSIVSYCIVNSGGDMARPVIGAACKIISIRPERSRRIVRTS